MARVLGVGGVFFRAADPEVVGEWYRRVLGFTVEGWGGAQFQWPKCGYFVWSPFAADSPYFEPSDRPFMLNLIVDNLDGVLARAAAEGVEALARDDADPNGRFAWILDPLGIKIELWEPAPEALRTEA